jgi:hypothetical protein
MLRTLAAGRRRVQLRSTNVNGIDMRIMSHIASGYLGHGNEGGQSKIIVITK